MGCRGFVEHFFQCSDCSKHFVAMASEPAALGVTSRKDAVLWLWRSHNRVSLRPKAKARLGVCVHRVCNHEDQPSASGHETRFCLLHLPASPVSSLKTCWGQKSSHSRAMTWLLTFICLVSSATSAIMLCAISDPTSSDHIWSSYPVCTSGTRS